MANVSQEKIVGECPLAKQNANQGGAFKVTTFLAILTLIIGLMYHLDRSARDDLNRTILSIRNEIEVIKVALDKKTDTTRVDYIEKDLTRIRDRLDKVETTVVINSKAIARFEILLDRGGDNK